MLLGSGSGCVLNDQALEEQKVQEQEAAGQVQGQGLFANDAMEGDEGHGLGAVDPYVDEEEERLRAEELAVLLGEGDEDDP